MTRSPGRARPARRASHSATGMDAADVFPVPLFGLRGSCHEVVFKERGHRFVSEFFADLNYADDGSLIIQRQHEAVDPDFAAERTLRAVREGVTRSIGGKDVAVGAETICVHSDNPNAVEIVKAISSALGRSQNKKGE